MQPVDPLIGWPGGDWQATLRLTVMLALGYIWLVTIPWAYRDIRSRTTDPLSQLVGVVLVAALPLLGSRSTWRCARARRCSKATTANWNRRRSSQSCTPCRRAPSAGGRCRRTSRSARTAISR